MKPQNIKYELAPIFAINTKYSILTYLLAACLLSLSACAGTKQAKKSYNHTVDTKPDNALRIVVASCAKITAVEDQQVWRNISSQSPNALYIARGQCLP